MKYTTIYLGDNTIELFNSLLGKERVKVNGKTVSIKRSIAGSEHLFKVSENDKRLDCKLITKLSIHGIALDFYKDGQPIIKSPDGRSLKFFLVGIGVVAGFIVIKDIFF